MVASSQAQLASLGPGDHAAYVFRTESERRLAAARFVREGLEREERVVYLVDATLPEVLHAHLRYEGVDVAAHVRAGQLRFLPARAVYLSMGRFEPERMLRALASEMETTHRRGFRFLRVTGEMGWTAARAPGTERLVEYEQEVSSLIDDTGCTALCQYRRHELPDPVLARLLGSACHPVVVADPGAGDPNPTLEVSERDDLPGWALAGQLDLAAMGRFGETIGAGISGDEVRLEVFGLTGMEAGAARMLRRLAEELGSRIFLLHPQLPVRRLLATLGLDDGIHLVVRP